LVLEIIQALTLFLEIMSSNVYQDDSKPLKIQIFLILINPIDVL